VFTGIVEAVGQVRSAEESRVVVSRPPTWEDMTIGESVAVNGVCLTLLPGDDLAFDVSGETRSRTTLGALRPGSRVNLERAMTPQSRFGGHIVQGHVDATGCVDGVYGDRFRFSVPREFDRYLIDKGSITVDGVSLTVVRPEDAAFDVAVVPHTLEHTNLGDRRPGDQVNLEFDVLAKYVERLLRRDG
jgi:riboflavin synthase